MRAVVETRLLWSGGGSVDATSRRRRARARLRTIATEHPGAYLPFARRKYPGPSPRVIGPDTEMVIDGYTRTASTFAVYAFQLAQPAPVRLAHHLHAAAQLMESARRGLPTLVTIREPRGAVLSQLVREPDVDLLDALYAYERFHVSLMPYRESFVVGDFPEVTRDFGAVVRRLNTRFGTSYREFEGTVAQLAECNRMIELRPTRSPILLGFESGEVSLEEARAHLSSEPPVPAGEAVWAPSPARDVAKAALHTKWAHPRVAAARTAAESAYRAFTGQS
jgi:hypothetical protein